MNERGAAGEATQDEAPQDNVLEGSSSQF